MDIQASAPPGLQAGLTAVTSEWLRRDINDARNVVVVLMRKGGAGKTTEILLLADAFARLGLSVLVVDMDPQGNSSIGLDREVQLVEAGRTRIGDKARFEPQDNTICEVIESGERGVADEAIMLVEWGYEPGERFDRGGPLFPGRIGPIGVIPCYRRLESLYPMWKPKDLDRLATSLLLPSEPGLVAPHRRWDIVLIDTPPGGSLIAVQAAKAATSALFVTAPATFGAKAVPETMELVQDIKISYDHPDLDVIGLIINEYVPQGRRTQSGIITQLDEAHRRDVPEDRASLWPALWPVRIPYYTVIQDSQDSHAPVSAFLGVTASRTPARKVCQAAEANAVQLLHAIKHPQAAEIHRAWAAAWPPEHRADFVREG
jgi:chromosome partitioning protein